MGAAQQNISAKLLRNLRLPVPPLKEQQAIAQILGTLDDKIELNRRTNRTLEEIARTLFKSWFVDFDPVRAKVEGRPPEGMDAETAALFPDAFEESEFGLIPKGWPVVNIYSIARVQYGAPYKSKLFNQEGVGLPLIRIRDLKTHNPPTYTQEMHPREVPISSGDIVVGMDGDFRAHLWQGPEALLNQRLCTFRPKADAPAAFIWYTIERDLDFYERAKVGTTVIHLGKADIDRFRAVLPSPELLRRFGAVTDPVLDGMLSNAAELVSLAKLRDTLLPKLLSGDLRINDPDQFLEENVP